MAALLNSTALRALLLAAVLACVAALTASTARGSDVRTRSVRDGSSQYPSLTLSARTDYALLADDFSWHDFVRFWERQLGSMTGIVGTVMLIAGLAVLIIMSKGRG
jgi:hypothetical protein